MSNDTQAESGPVLGPIRRTNGVAGQVSYTVTATYPDESPEAVTFVGSVYGGPVIMIPPSGSQIFVSDPNRLGPFGPEWVRRFFN
jgi:hypothetical protein